MNILSSSFFSVWPWTTVDLLNHLWQSTVVALAVLLLLACCGRLPASTRRLLGWMALLKFAFPVAFLARFATHSGAPDRWQGSPTLTLPANWSPAVFSAPAGAAVPVGNVTGFVLTAVWLAGVATFLVAWLVRAVCLRRALLANARPVSSAMKQRIERVAARAGIRSFPRCVTGGSDHGPGILGVFSPILILPRGLEDTLSPAELDSVLIHELVHLRRRDNLWGALRAVFGSVLWFHPLVWLLNRRISVETEKSCDERVLQITDDPDTYADGIVKAARHALGLAQPGFAGVTTPPVVERLEAILAHRTHRDLRTARHAALVAGVSLLALSGYAGSFTSTSDEASAAIPASAASAEVTPSAIAPLPETTVAPSALVPGAPPISAVVERNNLPASSPSVEMEPAPPANALPLSTTSQTTILASQPEDLLPAMTESTSRQNPSTPEEERRTPVRTTSTQAESNDPTNEVMKPPARSTASAGVQVLGIKNLDQMPVVKFRTNPVYPLYLQRSEMSGQVIVDFIVDTNGDVRNAYAVRPPNRDFGLSAVEAVKQWKFQPGMKRGLMVNTHLQVPIIFAFHKD